MKAETQDPGELTLGEIVAEANRMAAEGPTPDPAMAEILAGALIVQGCDYPEPEAIVEVLQDGRAIPIATRGSFSVITGKAKSRKTTLAILLASAMIRSIIYEGSDTIRSPDGGRVCWVDTEQGGFYAAATQERILSAACIWDRRCEALQFFDFREFSPDVRVRGIEHLLSTTKGVDLLVIDGIRDLLFDINDASESVLLVNHLMRWSKNHNMHVLCVLHQNKSDGHARGHLGTEAINKAETVITVNVADDDPTISVVQPAFTRGSAFEPFAISHDGQGMPCLTDYTPAGPARRPSRIDTIRSVSSEVFSGQVALKYGDAINAIMRASGKGECTAKAYLKEMVAHEMVIQGEDKNYRTNSEHSRSV